MDNNFERIEFEIHQMVSPNWFTTFEGSSVWISGYRMQRISIDDLPSGPKYFDLYGVRCFFVYGVVSFLDSKSATPIFTNDGNISIDASVVEASTPEGAYLTLVLPFEIDGQPGNEKATRDRISDVVGLLAVFNSRNIVYEHLFDYEYLLYQNELGKTERRVIGETIINPFSMPVPNIDDVRLSTISAVDNEIEGLIDQERNRIRLSLRWFQAAIYDIGVNAFLKYWIAIETLAMPDTTNIRPINELLSRIYGLEMESVVQRFKIGRVFNLRGKIVHQGEQIPIRGDLLDYLEAVYSDILFAVIDQPSEKKADNFLQSSNSDIGGYILSL